MRKKLQLPNSRLQFLLLPLVIASLAIALPTLGVSAQCVASCPSGQVQTGECIIPAQEGVTCDGTCVAESCTGTATGSCEFAPARSGKLCGAAVTPAPAAPTSSGSCPQGALCLPNPLGESRIQVIAGRVIGVLTGGAGMIALLMFIYGGFQWLTAAGNPEKIKKGRDILVWSVLGMIIMFGAYVGVRYILQALVAGVSQP